MTKNRKHSSEFRLQIIKYNLHGNSIGFLSRKWNISTWLIRKWIDQHHLSGANGLLRRRHVYYTKKFKLEVITVFKDKKLSLRDCCLHFNIPAQSTLLSWLRKYQQLGLDGLSEKRGRPSTTMKKQKPAKNTQPLIRLEELEKENLYLRAEIDFLKKLDALTLEKQTQQSKNR